MHNTEVSFICPNTLYLWNWC